MTLYVYLCIYVCIAMYTCMRKRASLMERGHAAPCNTRHDAMFQHALLS